MLEFVFRDLSSYSLKPISVISLYKIFKKCLMACGLTPHKHKLEQFYVSTFFFNYMMCICHCYLVLLHYAQLISVFSKLYMYMLMNSKMVTASISEAKVTFHH